MPRKPKSETAEQAPQDASKETPHKETPHKEAPVSTCWLGQCSCCKAAFNTSTAIDRQLGGLCPGCANIRSADQAVDEVFKVSDVLVTLARTLAADKPEALAKVNSLAGGLDKASESREKILKLIRQSFPDFPRVPKATAKTS